MNASVVLFIVSLLILILLLSRVLKQKRPQAPLIRRLREAGVRVGDTEQLMAGGVFWERQAQLMTDREVHFMQGLFRAVDMRRWYLCPQVRVADIVQITPRVRGRSRTWWKLFHMAAQWHCDVVIVDRRTFRVVAAVELDDASHLKKSRCRRDILLDEVMRQAGMPLLRSRDARELQRMIRDFLKALEAESGVSDAITQQKAG
ncbi:DUF2726 domain-containing protein [Enterobacter bugandensis]|uniref:DUF2726 domain-containing protein n=1 Tax=Enterobacter bugandensis TaxID=881260 RepID=UPI0020058664|nr:DUF2726 domain-containing protein [Enterobacter bugandensis]MCK7068903.1 DUF2726 domain-containing protein [Enterobacter bugandensis]